MRLILIFLTLIVFAKSSFALFGVFDKDFCKNNPDDFLCSTSIVESTQKSTKKTSTPTVPSSTQSNKNIKINLTQTKTKTKTNVTEFKPLVKKQIKYDFDNLYNQMNADINEAANKKIKKNSKDNDAKRTSCNSIKSFPFAWKKDFSKKYKINANSIKFLSATFKEGTYGSCSVMSSSDRGICNHLVYYSYTTPYIVSSISNECK